uniref:Uncharacterized protein n=1 Tax=Zea mays TaxID=4577 RepID=B6UF47_MAIZE|nr:hypothetical protein [Zea mays]
MELTGARTRDGMRRRVNGDRRTARSGRRRRATRRRRRRRRRKNGGWSPAWSGLASTASPRGCRWFDGLVEPSA